MRQGWKKGNFFPDTSWTYTTGTEMASVFRFGDNEYRYVIHNIADPRLYVWSKTKTLESAMRKVEDLIYIAARKTYGLFDGPDEMRAAVEAILLKPELH